jgi:hypothetical protein
MKLQIRVGEDGIIEDVKFKTFGCGSAIASSSYMTERVKGLSLEEAGKVKNTEIAKELCLPPVKREYGERSGESSHPAWRRVVTRLDAKHVTPRPCLAPSDEARGRGAAE